MALPHMPFYPGDYLASTAHLTTEEHGAYCLLIFAYWTKGGPLPNDDGQLSRVTRMSKKRWQKVRSTLIPFFSVVENKWVHSRVESELEKAKAKVEKARLAGRRSGESRRTNTTNGRSTDVQQTLNGRSTDVEPQTNQPDPDPDPKLYNPPNPPMGGANKSQQKRAERVELPDWLDEEAWKGYAEHRKRLRKPMTHRAQELLIGKLTKWRALGHKPNDLLDEAVEKGWVSPVDPSDRDIGYGAKRQRSITELNREAGDAFLRGDY